MKPYNHFYKNWLVCSIFEQTKEYLDINLDIDFFNNLCFDDDSIKQYRLDAAKYCAETLGDKPALCISGGADSQAMVQCFYEAGYNFDVYILAFKNDLNIQDVGHARQYCAENGIKLYELDFDILSFLSRENFDYGCRYECPSPHFNTHFKMFDILRSMGYTSVVCGGNVPLQRSTTDNQVIWGGGYSRNVMSFIKYTEVSGFLAQGNFLSFYPQLAWVTSILTPRSENFKLGIISKSDPSYEDIKLGAKLTYDAKIIGYNRAGFNIIPQETKYTGFELIKKYYESVTGDGWSFEKKFRYPLERELLKYGYAEPKINLDYKIKEKIDSLYNKYLLSGDSSTGI